MSTTENKKGIFRKRQRYNFTNKNETIEAIFMKVHLRKEVQSCTKLNNNTGCGFKVMNFNILFLQNKVISHLLLCE